MRVSSLLSSSGSRTIFGKYLKDIRASDRNSANAVRNAAGSIDSASAAVNDLKAKLAVLAKQAEKFKDTDSTFNRSTSPAQLPDSVQIDEMGEPQEPPPPPPPPVTSGTVSVSTSATSKPLNFDRQIMKALSKGFESGDEKILKNRNLSGNVTVKVGSEEYTVSVDGDTTAQEFADALNTASGGKLDAKLVERGDVFKISVKTGAPPATPDGENPPPGGDEVILGEGSSGAGGFEGDIGELVQQLKRFAGTYNDLVGYVRRDNGSASLSETEVDDGLVSTLKTALKSSTGDSGRVEFDEFVNFNASGRITVDEAGLKKAFSEDPDAVVEVFTELAANIGGRQGVVRDYNAKGGVLDQAVNAIAQSQLTKLTSVTEKIATSSTATTAPAGSLGEKVSIKA